MHFGGASEEGEAVGVSWRSRFEKVVARADVWRGNFILVHENRARRMSVAEMGRNVLRPYKGRGKISRLRLPVRTTARKRPSGEMLNSRNVRP